MSSRSALVLIYDIRGFTAASKRMGTADLGAFMTGAHRTILDLFAEVPPTFVKNLGDGHLLLWESATDAPDADLVAKVVAGAERARTAFTAFVAGREATGTRLPKAVGIGVAFGEVSRQDDYYGVALNLAARLQNLARPEGLALDRNVFETVAARDAEVGQAFQRSRVRLKGLGATTVFVRRPFSWSRLLGRVGRVAALLLVPLVWVLLSDAGLAVPGGAAVRSFLDAREVSLFRRARLEGEVAATADTLRRAFAERIVKARAAGGWVRSDLRRLQDELIDVWSSSQAIAALVGAPHLRNDDLRPFLPGLEACFSPDVVVAKGGKLVGWPAHPGYSYVEIEPALWTVVAFARALGRPGLVPEADRDRFGGLLAEAQRVAQSHYPPGDGGWNIFPNQQDPEAHSPYSTSLAFLALLDTRAAGLPWAGSVERRDALIQSTARRLAATFVAEAVPPGWRRTHEALNEISPGLTLQTYGLLLRAEAEAGIPVPTALFDAMTRHLMGLEGANMDQPADAGEFNHFVVGDDGKVAVQSESINFLWHPWAVDAAARWLDRAARAPVPPEQRYAVRRVLGHLVLGLGDEAVRRSKDTWVFISSETLMGLCAVRPPGAD